MIVIHPKLITKRDVTQAGLPEPSHTAVGPRFADLVVMLSAVYRTHKSHE